MTDREASGTSGGAAGTGGGRRDLGFYAMVFPIGLGIALVNALSVADEAHGRLPLWKPATWELSSVLVIALMTVPIMALTRRVWPLSRPRWRVMLVHGPAMLAFTLIHVIAAGILRWAVYAAVGDYYDPWAPLRNFIYEGRKDVLIYCAIVSACVVWRRYVMSKAKADAKASPSLPEREAIEVRDGARRRFIALADVAWIEAAGNYVELHQGAAPVLHRASLSEMERQLQPRGFIRIHRSRLVRKDAVTEVESKPSGDYVVRLADGRELAGSRRYRRPLLEP